MNNKYSKPRTLAIILITATISIIGTYFAITSYRPTNQLIDARCDPVFIAKEGDKQCSVAKEQTYWLKDMKRYHTN